MDSCCQLRGSSSVYRDSSTYQVRNMSATTSTAWNTANTIQYIIHWVCCRGHTHIRTLYGRRGCDGTYVVSVAACPHCLEGGVGRIKDTRRHSVRCVREEERERVCGNSDCAGITAHLHDSSREDGGNHGVLLAPHQLCDLQVESSCNQYRDYIIIM